ncbi:MAG: alpha/beta hydrolase [Actinobacteria bacterium]|nr:MAG: alpha/beta hydrolase [Actinomycetota bacterium]
MRARATSFLAGVCLAAAATVSMAGSPAHAFGVLSGTTVVRDVPYATVGDVTLTLDVYAPDQGGPHPAVLVIHGGIWKKGDKSQWEHEGSTLAAGGFVAFVANYRLDCKVGKPPPGVPPELCGYHAPAPIDDLKSAVEWIRANAATYGALPDHVGALGGSAGGNLALMLATSGVAGQDKPEAVVSWSGNTELWRYDLAKDPVSAERNSRRYIGCPYTGNGSCPDQWYAASPITGVTADDTPSYLANSTRETIPLQVAQDMDAALAASGVPHFLRVLEGAKHERQYEDVVVDPNTGTTVFQESVAWLHAYLG